MTRYLSRRVLLRGLGGAVVAAPFLSSVAERAARTQGLPPPAPPRRLIVFFTHYGCLTNRWFPAKSHGPLGNADYAAMGTLAPMAPYADKLLMVRGIRAMNEWSFPGTLGQTLDPHTQACASFFTCHPLLNPIANPRFTPKPSGRSLDHVCAEQVSPNGAAPLFIQIGGLSLNSLSNISFSDADTIYPGLWSPNSIFSYLTNLFGTAQPLPDTYRVARGKSVIDCVRDDLNNLMRVDMSQSDRRKLADWAALLHYTGGSVTRQCSHETAARLGLTSDTVAAASTNGSSSDLTKIAPVVMDLAVLSAICDSSRVIFMKMPPTRVFGFLGLTVESHGISHRIGNASMGGACIPNALDQVQAIDAWYAQQFAHLVGRLDSFSEGDRTLLDNSATVWFQEMSDGNAHNLNNLPILQAGGCGGAFKTGWAINVEGGKADMTPGHSDEDCKDGQSPFSTIEQWGTPPDVATQPINKYFCNLMNAIGVKAGSDGHPVKGGTQPVTHYGKYDDTTLFNTDAPPLIKNPGEYAELRAS